MLAVALLLAAGLAACGKPTAEAARAERGKRLMGQYQCGACHRIPGVEATPGRLAAPLAAFGRRSYIAGRIPNTDAALQRWLMDPPALVPGTLMPDLGVTADDAAAMTAYLRSLR